MEGTEITSTPATPPATPPASAPLPSTPPQVVTSTPATSGSGSNGGSLKSIVSNLDWVQVGFGVLISTTLFYAIYYFRYNIAMNKKFVGNVENKIDDLTIKYSDVSSVLNKPQDASQQDMDVFI